MTKQIGELAAMLMIGDGILAATIPDCHLRLWELGPRSMRRAIRAGRRHEGVTRTLGALEAAAGVWLATRLTE